MTREGTKDLPLGLRAHTRYGMQHMITTFIEREICREEGREWGTKQEKGICAI